MINRKQEYELGDRFRNGQATPETWSSDVPTESSSATPMNAKPLAIFDLDGTLTTKDSFLAYLLSFGRRNARYRALSSMPFFILAHLGRMMKDYELKQRMIRNFITGVDPKAVDDHTAWFCENWLPHHLHPIGNRLLKGHLQKQHRVILLSASPNIFVPQIAEALGIKEVICTRIKQVDGAWQGEIDGKNCKGSEKVVALRSHLNMVERPVDSYSYGDSKSDLAVLSWVEHGAWIRRNDFSPLDGVARSVFPWSET